METSENFLEGIKDVLPSADFDIGASDDENEDDTVAIFSRPDENDDSSCREFVATKPDDSIKRDEIILEDIEGVPSDKIDLEDEEWKQFKDQFQSVLESSEEVVLNASYAGQVQKIKDDLLASVLESFQGGMAMGMQPEVTVEMQTEPSLSVDNDDKVNDSNMRPSRKVLHSSRYERISESDLDIVLESIKEESREGSVSPTWYRDGDPSFKWERMPSPAAANEKLMEQLMSACGPARSEDASTTAVASGNIIGVKPNYTVTSDSNQSQTIHLDLRPQTDQHEEAVTETTKRLMMLRGGKKSSSDDSEDNCDPYTWQEERKKYKMISMTAETSDARSTSKQQQHKKNDKLPSTTSITSSNTTTASTTVSVTTTKIKATPSTTITSSTGSTNGVTTGNTIPLSTTVKYSRHHTTSDSISEDDVFDVTVKEEETSSSSSSCKTVPSPEKPVGKSKRKKRKGRSQSGSGSSSDGESKGKPKKGKETSGEKKHSQRKRTDSLTQSSDEELVLKRPGTTPFGRSYSEGDGESVYKDLEKLKYFLQRTIESRKPPSLFDTPNTPPLFHQDISFSAVLPSTNPSISPIALLLLPLTDNGLVDMDTADLPSNTLDLRTTQLLHILLLTWLVSLAGEESHQKDSLVWRPFHITGLQQTIIDGLAYIIVTIGSTDSMSSESQLFDLLKCSELKQILNPLLSTLDLVLNDETRTNLQSISSTPLSCMFTIQSDISSLTTPLSFYTHSLYTPQSLPTSDSIRTQSPLQTSVCTIQHHHLHNTKLVFTLLHEAGKQGLDIAGARLVYYQEDFFNSSFKGTISTSRELQTVLAIAFRGPNAISCITDIIGPEDHSIALVTDPNSLSAKYGKPSSPPLVSSVHNQYWTTLELAKWFGGRACLRSGSIIGVSDAVTKSERRKRQKVRFSESESEDIPLPDDIAYPPLISNRPALLVYPYSKIILVASPHVNPRCYSAVLRSAMDSGFDLLGIKRLRLNSKRALSLSIPPSLVSHFTPSSNPASPEIGTTLSPLSNSAQSTFPPLPSLLLTLGRENSALHIDHLINTVCTNLKGLSPETMFDITLTGTPGVLLHAIELTEDCLKVIGSFTFTPSNSNVGKPSSTLIEEEGFKEEICFLAVPGHDSFKKALNVLDIIYKTPVGEEGTGGFELLGIKVTPNLSRFQAKQLCPHAQGSPGYQESVDFLSGKPSLLFVFRGIKINERVSKLLKGPQQHQILSELSKTSDVICSSDLAKAYRLTSLFFIDKELFSHPCDWSSAAYVPSSWINDCSILSSLTTDPVPLLSVFTISIAHVTLLVKVLQKLHRVGFRIVGMRLVENGNQSKHVLEDTEKDAKVTPGKVSICIERYNGVWYLAHELKQFTSSSPSYSKALYYSPTFVAAVIDVQYYFPFGVYSTSTTLHKYYQISSAPLDIFKSHVGSPKVLTPPTSPLSEDAYLILPPTHLTSSLSSAIPSYVTALDILNKASFFIINVLMIKLSKETAKDLYHNINETTIKESELSSGPCLVIGVRRDNAVSCFHSIITSSFLHLGIREDTATITKLFQSVLVTATTLQAAAVKKILKLQEDTCNKWF